MSDGEFALARTASGRFLSLPKRLPRLGETAFFSQLALTDGKIALLEGGDVSRPVAIERMNSAARECRLLVIAFGAMIGPSGRNPEDYGFGFPGINHTTTKVQSLLSAQHIVAAYDELLIRLSREARDYIGGHFYPLAYIASALEGDANCAQSQHTESTEATR